MTTARKRYDRLPVVALWALMLESVAMSGCAGSDQSSGRSVRDSAGVMIIESSAQDWAGVDAWTVGDAPTLELGQVEGHEDYLFSVIVGVWRTGNGRIVVADRMAAEIKVFDSSGELLSKFGGRGGAPGEFRELVMAAPYRGDSIAAWDAGARQLSLFDGQGGLGRTIGLSLPPPLPQGDGPQSLHISGEFTGAFADGTFVFEAPLLVRGSPGERLKWESTILHYSANGDLLDTLGTFPGREFLAPVPGRPMLRTPFPRTFSTALRGGEFFVASSLEYEIEVVGTDRRVRRLIRARHKDLTMTAEAREAYRESQSQATATANVTSEELARALRETEFPASLPPYSEILMDSDGYLWVRDYRIPGTVGPEVWSVFGRDGRVAASVETPDGLRVEQIGRDFVLGIWTNELDVPTIRIYELVRN